MSTGENPHSGSFRERLSQIPDAESRRPTPDWDGAKPPIVERQRPVARPQPTPREQVSAAPHAGQVEHFELEEDFVDQGFEPPRRRRWPLVLIALLIIVVLLVGIPVLLARQTFNSIERVPVAQTLTPAVPAGTNILLVGTDSRDGIDDSTENSGAILGEGISGERTDTMMILRLRETGGSQFLSLPRDLWLPINGGAEQRINTAFAQGPEALVNTIQGELGIPISHYVQVDLAGFIEVVDAVGGVDVTIEHPAFDEGSGLDLPTAGTVTLDSTQALAWVRSRRYTEVIDGVPRQDPTSDLGRVARQQEFMRALVLKVSEQRNPIAVNGMLNSISQALILDDATSFTDSLDIANSLRTSVPESVVLPTLPDTRGSNSVLVLAPGSDEVLRLFGAP